MILSSKTQFQRCVSVTSEQQFVANYKGLDLRSVYQPIFDNQNSVVGVEALVRICNEKKQNIRPDLFFDSPDVSLEDKINVERLSRVIHIRNFSNSKYRKLNLFLNVLPSAGEYFALEDLKDGLLSKRLRDLHIDNTQLVMEVVELDSRNEKCLQHAMNRLAQHGFNIAIDDYGMQASTRERVELLKPAIIKIDRKLLLDYMDGDEQPILEGIKLAREFSARIVVEGIETKEQHQAMKRLDIDMFQGYYLATPKPIAPLQLEKIS
ncbi:EAL domain-containing protein [Vibrio sp. LaRot3]|uniref:EAL domain-containing protein n=1 Tax=Vibrio sp. LaRot3 TaxID=2998829 RepID=UPI0022CE085F|nr:EAL domain-containing protein [Vibrio sp. LaRot3]MDA0148305.1 EAL domain-containing protein [Vibrio sp. LaRot3]